MRLIIDFAENADRLTTLRLEKYCVIGEMGEWSATIEKTLPTVTVKLADCIGFATDFTPSLLFAAHCNVFFEGKKSPFLDAANVHKLINGFVAAQFVAIL